MATYDDGRLIFGDGRGELSETTIKAVRVQLAQMAIDDDEIANSEIKFVYYTADAPRSPTYWFAGLGTQRRKIDSAIEAKVLAECRPIING